MSGLIGHRGLLLGDGSTGPSYDSVMLGLSPWGYWKLDESPITGGSTVADDSSTNARDGLYATGAWTTTGGLFPCSSGCPVFNSSSNYASVPSITLAVNQKFSIVAFIKTTYAGGTAKSIFGMDFTGTRKCQFRISSGKLELVTITPSVTTTTSVASINSGTSRQVAVVFDPTLAAGAGVVKLYIDGALDIASTTAITITNGAIIPGIGSRNGSASQDNWDGNIDNVALFDTAITGTDIAALWAARNSP